MQLQEAQRPQPLPEEDDRLEDEGALAEAVGLVTGGEEDLAGEGEDAAAFQTVEEDALQAESDVADPFAPPSSTGRPHLVLGKLPRTERHHDLELVPCAEALLVDELPGEFGRTFERGAGDEQHLVLDERLLRQEGAGEVEFAAWPGWVWAEALDVRDGSPELGLGERSPEGGHHLVEGLDGAAVMPDPDPVLARLA